MQHQRVSVSSPADDDLPGVQQLAVPVPLHLGRRGGVDGAGDLHLVPVPAVDECFLLLYLRLVLHVQADLEQKIRIFVKKNYKCPTLAEAGLPHPLSAKQL